MVLYQPTRTMIVVKGGKPFSRAITAISLCKALDSILFQVLFGMAELMRTYNQ